jgi:hypothetical protein
MDSFNESVKLSKIGFFGWPDPLGQIPSHEVGTVWSKGGLGNELVSGSFSSPEINKEIFYLGNLPGSWTIYAGDLPGWHLSRSHPVVLGPNLQECHFFFFFFISRLYCLLSSFFFSAVKSHKSRVPAPCLSPGRLGTWTLTSRKEGRSPTINCCLGAYCSEAPALTWR